MRIGETIRRAYERGERAFLSFWGRLPETELEREAREVEEELESLRKNGNTVIR